MSWVWILLLRLHCRPVGSSLGALVRHTSSALPVSRHVRQLCRASTSSDTNGTSSREPSLSRVLSISVSTSSSELYMTGGIGYLLQYPSLRACAPRVIEFGQLMPNHQWHADRLMYMSPYTNTIFARQCIMSSDKFLE